jgi:hypothetical protein
MAAPDPIDEVLSDVHRERANALTMTRIVVAAWVLFISVPVTAQVSAPQLWKARAFEAADKLKTLEAKIDRLRKSWQSPEANALKCEGMLETAFILHLTEEAIVHKVLNNGKHGFKIVLSGGDQGVFELMYIYDPQTWHLIAASVLSLPKAWHLVFPASALREMGDLVLIIQGEQATSSTWSMAFSLNESFWAHVQPSQQPSQTPPPQSKGRSRPR